MRLSDFLWSEEEVARLKRRRADGLSFGQIGREMGLTRNAVIGKAQRLGMISQRLGPRSPLEAVPEAIKRARARGKPMKPLPEIPPTFQAEKSTWLPPEVSPHACGLLELAPASCRWPIADGPWLFCGATKLDGYSYCSRHHALAHQKSTPRLTVPMAWNEPRISR